MASLEVEYERVDSRKGRVGEAADRMGLGGQETKSRRVSQKCKRESCAGHVVKLKDNVICFSFYVLINFHLQRKIQWWLNIEDRMVSRKQHHQVLLDEIPIIKVLVLIAFALDSIEAKGQDDSYF